MATDDDDKPSRKPTPEEVNARFARLCVGAPPSKERDEELANRIRSRPRAPAPIDDAHLNEIVQTTAPPTAREAIADRAAADAVPAHLAEAQVSLVGRCAVCGKPVTGRDVPRDRHGRPRHHRCPP